MKILVINSGSSSIKCQLMDTATGAVMAKQLVERIGIEGAFINHTPSNGSKVVIETPIPDHGMGIKLVLDNLVHPDHGVIESLDEIDAIGHRVVHGADKFAASVVIDDTVVDAIEECSVLAPLHNPPNLLGIRAAQRNLPGKPNVAVFDTAFHQRMPRQAYIYALPYEFYEKHRIRRYGFHGTSHQYVAMRCAELLGKPFDECKIVTCHLGNGSSIAAVDRGHSVDTSLGFGTMCGVPMGTRAGDVDPAIIEFMMTSLEMSPDEIKRVLYKESGIKGLSGTTNDLRDVHAAVNSGSDRAALALEVFTYSIKKYIGAYAAAMGGLDAVVFTAGIGEKDEIVRQMACRDLDFMGVDFDVKKNLLTRGSESELTRPGSRVKVFLIPTDEEKMIALETERLAVN